MANTTPQPTDAKLTRWVKILNHYQNQGAALSCNNHNPLDSLRTTLVKVLRAITGSCVNGSGGGSVGVNIIPASAQFVFDQDYGLVYVLPVVEGTSYTYTPSNTVIYEGANTISSGVFTAGVGLVYRIAPLVYVGSITVLDYGPTIIPN